MNKSETIGELAKSLFKFQENVKNPNNNAKNPQYRSEYATLDNVINTVKPILSQYGLSYIQSPSTSEDGLHIGVTTLLMHESGEWIESDPLVLPAYKLGKDSIKIYDAQAAGIAVSYARRYSLSAILGISSESDDDGNGIRHEASSKPNYNNQQSGGQAKGGKASDKQIKMINAKISELEGLSGHTRDVIKTSLAAKSDVGKFESVAEMTVKQASASITYLTQWIKDKGGQ